MEVQRLDILVRVEKIRAESYPARQLVFDLSMEPLSDRDLQLGILNSWTQLYLGDACVTQGTLLQVFSGLIVPTTIGGIHLVSATVRAPLTTEVLQAVEDKRVGKDLDYRIVFSVAALPIRQVLGLPQLGVPQTVHLRDRHNNGDVSGTIPQSDWVQLLRQMNWGESRLMEIPITIAQTAYPLAFRYLEEAHDHFRRGHWHEAMTSCRKVAESVAGHLGGYGENGVDPKKLRLAVGEGAKGDRIDDLTTKLGQFLHLGRHDSNVVITRYDALLALQVTTALFSYWCRPQSSDVPI